MMWRAGLVVGLALAACASRSSMKRELVREVAYLTDFDTVWKATTEELTEAFETPGLRVEDPRTRTVETNWKPIDNTADPADKKVARYVFRMRAVVVPEGSGWRIDLDGEAAFYRPNMTVLQPFRHGVIDEPQWVQGRIDSMRAQIHERLQAFATLSRPNIQL